MEQTEPSRAATLVPDAPATREPAPALPRPPMRAAPAPIPARRPYLPLRPHRRLARADRAITAALFLGSLGLYTATLTRDLSVVSGDSNELIVKSALFQVAHSPGSPTYEWIGKLLT